MIATSASELRSTPASGRRGATRAANPARSLSAAEISSLPRADVDDIFRAGTVGQIPDGEATGTALFFPGSSVQPLLERLVRSWAWQGKRFRAGSRRLENLVSPFGIRAISAEVYQGRSWFDAEACIVLDYSRRSFVARKIRDEIRRVAPGLYLGLVYWEKTRLMYFMLQFPA
jgi:hypothetical protein